jgi:hypothetical protein
LGDFEHTIFFLLPSWETLAILLLTPPHLGRPGGANNGRGNEREGQKTGEAEPDLAIESTFLEGMPNVLYIFLRYFGKMIPSGI